MEWKYLEKDPPKNEGKYLIYTLKGRITVNEYRHMAKGKRKDGSEYFCVFTNTYGDEDIGYHFISKGSSQTPLDDVVLYAEIPPIPYDLDKKNAEIRKYQAEIRKYKERIKALKEGKEEA